MSRLRSITNAPPERRAPSTSFSENLRACRSEPQIPHARLLTSTSPGPGVGTGTSSTTSFLFLITAARMGNQPPFRAAPLYHPSPTPCPRVPPCGLVLAVVERDAFALRVDVRFERAQLGIVGVERFALDGILDAPVDHVAEQRDALKLDLVLRVGFRMGVGSVGMTHVAAHADSAAEFLPIMEDSLAFIDELLRLGLPHLVVAGGEACIGVALLLAGALARCSGGAR